MKKYIAVGLLAGISVFMIVRYQTNDDDREETLADEDVLSGPLASEIEERWIPEESDAAAGIPEHEGEEAVESVPDQKVEIDEVREFQRDLEELGLLGTPVVDSSGRISEEMQMMFDLTEEETDRLNRVLTDAAEALRDLELREMEVSLTSPNEVVVTIGPLGSEGREIEQRLREAFLEELGSDDGTLIWDIMTVGMGNRAYWAEFGRMGVEWNIRLEPQEVGVSYRFDREFSDSPRFVGGFQLAQNQSTRGWAVSSEDALEYLERNLGRQRYIVNDLPDGFRNILSREHEGEPPEY